MKVKKDTDDAVGNLSTTNAGMAAFNQSVSKEDVDESFFDEIEPFSASSSGWMRTYLRPSYRLKNAGRKEFKIRPFVNTFSCNKNRRIQRMTRMLLKVKQVSEYNGVSVDLPEDPSELAKCAVMILHQFSMKDIEAEINQWVDGMNKWFEKTRVDKHQNQYLELTSESLLSSTRLFDQNSIFGSIFKARLPDKGGLRKVYPISSSFTFTNSLQPFASNANALNDAIMRMIAQLSDFIVSAGIPMDPQVIDTLPALAAHLSELDLQTIEIEANEIMDDLCCADLTKPALATNLYEVESLSSVVSSRSSRSSAWYHRQTQSQSETLERIMASQATLAAQQADSLNQLTSTLTAFMGQLKPASAPVIPASTEQVAISPVAPIVSPVVPPAANLSYNVAAATSVPPLPPVREDMQGGSHSAFRSRERSPRLPSGSHHQFPLSSDPYDIGAVLDPIRGKFDDFDEITPKGSYPEVVQGSNNGRNFRNSQAPAVSSVGSFNPRETIPFFHKDKSTEASAFGWLLKFSKHVRYYKWSSQDWQMELRAHCCTSTWYWFSGLPEVMRNDFKWFAKAFSENFIDNQCPSNSAFYYAREQPHETLETFFERFCYLAHEARVNIRRDWRSHYQQFTLQLANPESKAAILGQRFLSCEDFREYLDDLRKSNQKLSANI